jgi:hypothetical protein
MVCLRDIVYDDRRYGRFKRRVHTPTPRQQELMEFMTTVCDAHRVVREWGVTQSTPDGGGERGPKVLGSDHCECPRER